MPVKRYVGQPLPIVVQFPGNPLEVYNKTYGDIVDVSMNLKQNLATDADDAYLEKKLTTSGVVVDQNRHKFVMILSAADYAGLVAGQTYYLTLNILVNGIVEYLEMGLQDRVIEITTDTNRA